MTRRIHQCHKHTSTKTRISNVTSAHCPFLMPRHPHQHNQQTAPFLSLLLSRSHFLLCTPPQDVQQRYVARRRAADSSNDELEPRLMERDARAAPETHQGRCSQRGLHGGYDRGHARGANEGAHRDLFLHVSQPAVQYPAYSSAHDAGSEAGPFSTSPIQHV